MTYFHQVETCITSSINEISKEDVLATNMVAEVKEIMEFECKDVKKEREHESIDAKRHEGPFSGKGNTIVIPFNENPKFPQIISWEQVLTNVPI